MSDMTKGKGESSGLRGYSSRLFPVRFLGLSLFIAWQCCTHLYLIFPGNASDPTLRFVVEYGFRMGDIGTLLILGLLYKRIGRLSERPVGCLVASACTSLGTALLGLVLVPWAIGGMPAFLVSVATASGSAFLFCLWAEVYGQMGIARTAVNGGLSCLLSTVFFLLVSVVYAPYDLVLVALFPLLSFFAAFLSMQLLPHEGGLPPKRNCRIPWKLVSIMACAGFLAGPAGLLLSPDAESAGAVHRIFATGLFGATLLIMLLFKKGHVDLRLLARITLPLSLVALISLVLMGQPFAYFVSFLLKFAYEWITFFVLMMLANLVYRFEISSLHLFAIARAISESAMFMGVVTRRFVWDAGLMDNGLTPIVVSLGGVLIVFACTLVWMSEKSVTTDWGVLGVQLDGGMWVPSARERMLSRCDQLAEVYGLTAREAEILALLAGGRTRRDIEQELFLSSNTVKTHVSHIYQKLGIHSRSEVAKLFE